MVSVLFIDGTPPVGDRVIGECGGAMGGGVGGSATGGGAVVPSFIAGCVFLSIDIDSHRHSDVQRYSDRLPIPGIGYGAVSFDCGRRRTNRLFSLYPFEVRRVRGNLSS